MAEVRIAPCNCSHPYQDSKYGKGNRVHNVGDKSMTCTVCGSTKAK